jgi:hypothetical protein
VDENVFDLEGGLALEEIGETDSGPLFAKSGREKPAKRDALLAARIPQTGRKVLEKEEETGRTAVKLGPDE